MALSKTVAGVDKHVSVLHKQLLFPGVHKKRHHHAVDITIPEYNVIVAKKGTELAALFAFAHACTFNPVVSWIHTAHNSYLLVFLLSL